MEILQNRALKLRVRNPDRITSVIPRAVYMGEVDGAHEVLVPWAFDETLVLRNLGIKSAPSPINKSYTWPGIFRPMAHQKETAEFLTLNKRAYVFDEQGTGKTASAAWAADYLLNIGRVQRVLIICPVSIMQASWQQDLFKTLVHRTVGIAHGTAEQRRRVIASPCEFVVINYDGVQVVLDELIAGGFDLIIGDEANYWKNAMAQRSKAALKLVKPDTRVWLMTGTPAAQSPEDAFGLAKFVSPERVPKFFGAWKDMVMIKLSMFKWAPRPGATDIVHRALQPAIRHTKDECLDLPDMMCVHREVPMTKQQEKYYALLKEQLLITAAGEEISAVNAAAAMNKLLQLSCGCMYSDNHETVTFDASPRLQAMEEIIGESLSKTIVFAPFTHTIEMIQEYLDKQGISAAVINGAVTATNRGKIFSDFQYQADPRVLVIQPQAASHGVTLTEASTVIWFGPTMSFETFEQANARVHRKGQKHKCTIHMISGSPVEAKVYKALTQKGVNHVRLMDLYQSEFKE